jgi:hypothetical protein
MPRYLKVQWHHDFADEPVLLYSDVDDAGSEIRKVEVYRDGRLDWADETRATGTTMLSESVMPSVEEIDDQQEFSAEEISAAEFDSAWDRATGSGELPDP